MDYEYGYLEWLLIILVALFLIILFALMFSLSGDDPKLQFCEKNNIEKIKCSRLHIECFKDCERLDLELFRFEPGFNDNCWCVDEKKEVKQVW